MATKGGDMVISIIGRVREIVATVLCAMLSYPGVRELEALPSHHNIRRQGG